MIEFPSRPVQDLIELAHTCRICRIFHLAVLKYNKESPELPAVEINPSLRVWYEEDERLCQINFDFYDTEQNLINQKTGHIELHPVLDPEPRILPATASTGPEIWAWLLECKSTCLKSHSKCRQDHNEKFLPTRLLDIGPDQGSRIKLISNDDIPQSSETPTQYLSLSHKWGDSKFLALTSLNISQLTAGIDLKELPQTFRDAVLVSRHLGHQYLWIDSLCIIQDSFADWEQEASTMGQVYQNSIFNIAASESDVSSHGLFRQKDNSLWKPFRIKFRTSLIDKDYFCFYDRWKGFEDETPLNARGWVLQERLLSPRTIHFATPVFWECRELVACPAKMRISHQIPPEWNVKKIWPSWYSEHFDNTWAILKFWETSVGKYTKCSLTKSFDKLIAISGIARVVQSILNDDYVAGLWKHHLIRGLIWHVQPNKPFMIAKPYRAPSWSWASIDGPIDTSLSQNACNPLATILACQTTGSNVDVFGNLTDGFIELTATLIHMPREIYADLEADPYLDFRVSFETDPNPYSEDIFLLPISTIGFDIVSQKLCIFCLVVSPTGQRRGSACYQRVGSALLDANGNRMDSGIYNTMNLPTWVPPPWLKGDTERLTLV
ncbi:HET-domain-containing protein [Mytilinidion resinicola]|uniref:HET-domain-containing protein n=1 Tax=Mytilinidion resinicola TaxID=574789 RepID=A0A6A6YAT0_9PEZI|nr:HET-domain-containing protein [Mytilinidion resinicola]KAF2805678.1 HET-domain-containing protein [Mytilinidion resinicola]